MKKLLTTTTLLMGLLCPLSAQAIETLAKQAYMIDATTGAVLLNKEGETMMVPSSMSKLMTLYIVFQHLKDGRIKMEDTFTVSEKAWRMGGSKMFVALNSKVSVSDLLHGIVVQSGNDASIVMVEGIAGSEEAFVAEMNKAADKLGLTQSNFVNATGWPDEKHVMSAKDLSTLALRIITEFPEYYPIFAVKEFTYNNITQLNRDRLIGNELGVDGLKTGHTEAAGYGIVLSAKKEDRRLVLVINGLKSDNDRVKQGYSLLYQGFREFQNKTLVKSGMEAAKADVWLGESSMVGLVAQEDMVVTVPSGNNYIPPKYTLRYQSPVPAPIAKGTHIADLVITPAEGAPQTIPLVAANDVPKLSGIRKMWAVLKITLGMN